GNHIFGHVVGANSRGLPQIKLDALREALTVFDKEILSDVYIGWVEGYLDDERARFEATLNEGGTLAEFADKLKISHPREAFRAVAKALREEKNRSWLD
ncbi:MAG: type I-B CRISPR-associated protein Cas7/Cst2/DevR, partial [Bryobacteraceae bacterium]